MFSGHKLTSRFALIGHFLLTFLIDLPLTKYRLQAVAFTLKVILNQGHGSLAIDNF